MIKAAILLTHVFFITTNYLHRFVLLNRKKNTCILPQKALLVAATNTKQAAVASMQ